MDNPTKNKYEQKRLAEVYAYKINSTAEIVDLDFLTSMAAQICEAKIALVSLVTDTTQCFISSYGLDMKETSLDVSFCAHAINTPKQPLVIKDARLDKRFSNNPLTKAYPHIVFYAGIPLLSTSGYPLGTLCVIDDKPRELTDLQLTQLKKLSRQTMNLLELRRNQIELKQINSHLESFAGLAAHDLKEPLRMINQFMERLDRKYKDELDDTAQKYIHFAVDGSKRMNNLINELLAFANIGGVDSTSFEQVDLNEVLDDVQGLMAAVLEEKNARLKTTSLPVVWGDRIGLKMLFQNLIGNALKYQTEEIQPIIEISYTENDKFHTLNFKDNGIGISNENQSKVFDFLTKLHNKSKFAGTGMGLATCKKIIDIHNGNIWIESELGMGTTFYVSIPNLNHQ